MNKKIGMYSSLLTFLSVLAFSIFMLLKIFLKHRK